MSALEPILLIGGILLLGFLLQYIDTSEERFSTKEKLKLKEAEIRSKDLDVKLEIVKFKREELTAQNLPDKIMNADYKVLEDMKDKKNK